MVQAEEGFHLGPFGSLLMGSFITLMVSFASVFGYYYIVYKPRLKRRLGGQDSRAGAKPGAIDEGVFSLKTRQRLPPARKGKVRVLYASVKGTSKGLAHEAARVLVENGYTAEAEKLQVAGQSALCEPGPIMFVVPTYEGGKLPAAASSFGTWLAARVADGPKLPKGVRISIMGLGHSDYREAETYNKASKELYRMLRKLGAKPFGPGLVQGDEATHTVDVAFREWLD
eukprot:Sspe_Gene.100606::Locus_75283_Transcript_1_1_Confidence_1.000_Length_740::g.100606::m.100606